LYRNSNYKIGISMKLRSLVIGLLVISSLFTANAQSGDDGKDLNALQGTWRLAAGQIGGRKMTAEELKRAKLVFKGDRYTVRRGSGPTVTGIVKLNPATNPKSIDITDADGPYKGKMLLGISALKGDELKECFAPPAQARPTKFATKAGTSQFFHIWKHVND
jgi:uncharacterized protein (TIGR03067 family)